MKRLLPMCLLVACASLACSCSGDDAQPRVDTGGAAGSAGGASTGAGGGRAVGQHFVLVHGAWLGAWCWDDVSSALRADGATVTTVELPAHGADTTSLADATLEAYVSAVSTAVDSASEPITLVGHSLGGVVVTQVAENRPSKIKKLVYLAAYVPADGQALFDLAMTDTQSYVGMNAVVDAKTGTIDIPKASLMEGFLADGSSVAIARLQANYRIEPLAPFVTPVHTTVDNWGSVPKYYVFTTQDRALSYGLQQQMTTPVKLVATATLNTSHAPFLSQPALVVSTLEGL